MPVTRCTRSISDNDRILNHCHHPDDVRLWSDSDLRGNGEIKHYSIGKYLGSGAFGVVFKGWDKSDKKVVALKKVDIGKFRADARKMKDKIMTEVRMMRECSHDNIVDLLDHFENGPKEIYLVLEFCGGGNLAAFIDDSNGGLGEQTTQRFAKQIGSGLHYLHSQEPPITHRDLKPQNILLSEPTANATVKITDFGEAQYKKVVNGMTAFKTFAGTGIYMAPEILAKGGISDDQTYRSSGLCLTLSVLCLIWSLHVHSV